MHYLLPSMQERKSLALFSYRAPSGPEWQTVELFDRDDQVEQYSKPRSGKNYLLKLLQNILQFPQNLVGSHQIPVPVTEDSWDFKPALSGMRCPSPQSTAMHQLHMHAESVDAYLSNTVAAVSNAPNWASLRSSPHVSRCTRVGKSVGQPAGKSYKSICISFECYDIYEDTRGLLPKSLIILMLSRS